MTHCHYSQCIWCCYDINSVPSLKQFGETWQSGCKKCVCDKNTLRVQCVPLNCPIQEKPINCGAGEVLKNHTVDCCEKLTCGEWFKVWCFNRDMGSTIQLVKKGLYLFLYNSFIKPEKIHSVASL